MFGLGRTAVDRPTPPPHPPQAETSSAAPETPPPHLIATIMAEAVELRAQMEQLRAERHRLLETQQRVMELLGTGSPERILHDLRNLLNERNLFKALADAAG